MNLRFVEDDASAFEFEGEGFSTEFELEDDLATLGGPGSGNFGHSGRPGQIGGSAPSWTTGGRELRKEEHAAVKSYHLFSMQLNADLRDGKPLSDEQKRVMRDMDSAIRSSASDQAMTVYRTIPGSVVSHLKRGDIFQDKGFLSTTKVRESAEELVNIVGTDDVIMEIAVPRGTFGIDVNKAMGAESEFEDQHEVVLSRDTPLKVVSTKNGVLKLRVVDPRSLGGPGSGNFGHAGRPGEVGGSAPDGAVVARRFDSEEGYRWHEEGPVADWARNTLTKQDRIAITNYAAFGYTDINNLLRGEYPTQNGVVRPMTQKEIDQYGDRIRSMKTVLNPIESDTGDGVYSFSVFDNPQWSVKGPVVNERRVEGATRSAQELNDAIRERGYELTEDIEVSRYAYFPGMKHTTLEKSVGTTRIEDGFTSTMLGNAEGRLDSGPAAVKAESIHARTNSLDGMHSEVGSAVLFSIRLPKGTKVLSVEAARRTRLQYSDDLKDRGTRSESEILIGSGARFRVHSVERGPDSKYSGYTVPTTRIVMSYVGGGSSEGRS